MTIATPDLWTVRLVLGAIGVILVLLIAALLRTLARARRAERNRSYFVNLDVAVQQAWQKVQDAGAVEYVDPAFDKLEIPDGLARIAIADHNYAAACLTRANSAEGALEKEASITERYRRAVAAVWNADPRALGGVDIDYLEALPDRITELVVLQDRGDRLIDNLTSAVIALVEYAPTSGKGPNLRRRARLLVDEYSAFLADTVARTAQLEEPHRRTVADALDEVAAAQKCDPLDLEHAGEDVAVTASKEILAHMAHHDHPHDGHPTH